MVEAGEKFHPRFRVIDTNAVVELNRVIRAVISGPAVELGVLRTQFRVRLEAIIAAFCDCAVTSYTSRVVYDEEIDPQQPGSALRQADLDFFERLCADEEFATTVHVIYQRYLSTEAVDEEHIEAVRSLAEENLGRRDFSLAVLAFELSQNGDDVAIVTDDGGLSDLINRLRRRDTVNLGGRIYNTQHVYLEDSLTFIQQFHGCCKLSNDVWLRTAELRMKKCLDRFEGIDREQWNSEYQLLKAFMDVVTDDCHRKGLRELEAAFLRATT